MHPLTTIPSKPNERFTTALWFMQECTFLEKHSAKIVTCLEGWVTWNNQQYMEQTKKEEDIFNHASMKCERRPSTSLISRRVLVRPGISAYGSELCSSFPLSESQRQRRTTPTWITVNNEPSSQHGEIQDDSQQGQLYEHHCIVHVQGSLTEGRRCTAGYKLNNLIYAECCSLIEEIKPDSLWY